jgi:hypothetical protein
MKLDLGIQMSSILLHAQNDKRENGFEAWLKSSSVEQQAKNNLLQ